MIDKIKNHFKSVGVKRIIALFVGNVILGLGIALFKFAGMGNDPFTAMAFATSDVAGVPYPRFIILVNLLFFIIEVIWGRQYIGLGTIVNAVLLGYIVTFFYDVITSFISLPTTFLTQLPAMLVGVVITGLGVSFYQTSDAGISPFDSISIIMTDYFKKIPYFWNRVITDAFCALVTFICGGLLGLGTLVCAFCLGPVVHFFNKNLSEKVIGHSVEN